MDHRTTPPAGAGSSGAGTATPPATAADEPTEPGLPEPFEVSFDFDDDHCSSSPEFALDELHQEVPADLYEELKAELTPLTSEDAHTKLTDRADALEEALEEAGDYEPAEDDDDIVDAAEAAEEAARDLVEKLRGAARHLTHCASYCCCAMDAYESYGKDNLDDELSRLGVHTWAVLDPGWPNDDPEDDITGTLDIDTIWERESSRDGWSCCEVKWDGDRLAVGFSGYQCGTRNLILVPLTKEQDAAHDAWAETDSYATDLAARVVLADPAALAASVTLWASFDDPDEVFDDFESLLKAVTELGADQVADLPVEVAARLASTWTGTTTDLLRTSRDIVGLPSAAVGFAA